MESCEKVSGPARCASFSDLRGIMQDGLSLLIARGGSRQDPSGFLSSLSAINDGENCNCSAVTKEIYGRVVGQLPNVLAVSVH